MPNRDPGRNPAIFTTDELNVVEAKGYTLLNLLGEGSYAKVYKAEYRPPSKNVSGHPGEKPVQRLACKIINGKLASKEFVEKFLPRELSIITKIWTILNYAAPEIIRGVEHNPFLVDIWSCGILLYVILNQALPFEQTSRKSLYTAQMKKSWKWRKFVSTKASNNLKAFLPRLLQPQPHRRVTADQLLHFPWITEEMPQNLTVTSNTPEPLSMMTLKAVPSAMEHRFIPAATEVMNIAIPKEEMRLMQKSSGVLSSLGEENDIS
ncbi:unnamed protein product [Allacma fusca]|uniref:Protein kinase domain-containing protein n=1 Tax=Allacma fusca TaxID=39272 RepID=A0A8J2KGS7_9HEXA|nr:unnamed protein product [Allacma fusca]